MNSIRRGNKNKQMKNAFTMIELVFTLVIIAILSATFLDYIKNARQEMVLAKERSFAKTIERGVRQSYINIIDFYQGNTNAAITPSTPLIPTSDNAWSWGWANASVVNTSPLPSFFREAGGGFGSLRYTINTGGFTLSERNALFGKIESAFSGICTRSFADNSRLELRCIKLNNLRYHVNGAAVTVANAITPSSTSISPNDSIVVDMEYRRVSALTNNTTIVTYKFDLESTYQHLRSRSTERINILREGIKSFYNRVQRTEIKNSPSSGLNSNDDVFVPWQWKMLGGTNTSPTLSQLYAGVCVIPSGGSTCANLNNTSYWRSGTVQRGLVSRRVISRLVGGAKEYYVDGFGNGIYIHPQISQCGAGNYQTCTISAPSLPKDGYSSLGVFPSSAVVYIDQYANPAISASSWGREYAGF